jgi:hypothetical protein
MDNDEILNSLFNGRSGGKQGKLYKIVSKNTKKFFVCSGYGDPNKILQTHIENSRVFEELKCHYYASHEIIKHNDVTVELIAVIPVKNLDELKEYELEYILEHQTNCVNILDPRDNRTIIARNPDKVRRDIDKRAKELDEMIENATAEYVNEGMDYDEAKALVRQERVQRMNEIRKEVKGYFD